MVATNDSHYRDIPGIRRKSAFSLFGFYRGFFRASITCLQNGRETAAGVETTDAVLPKALVRRHSPRYFFNGANFPLIFSNPNWPDLRPEGVLH